MDLGDPDGTPPFLLLRQDWHPSPTTTLQKIAHTLQIQVPPIHPSLRVGATRLVPGEGGEVAVAQWGSASGPGGTPLFWDTSTWTGGTILPGETWHHVVTLLLSAEHAVTLNMDAPQSQIQPHLQTYTRKRGAEAESGKCWNPSFGLSDIKLKLRTFACLSGGDLTVLNGQKLYRYDLGGRDPPNPNSLYAADKKPRPLPGDSP